MIRAGRAARLVKSHAIAATDRERSSAFVYRPEVRKVVEQIAMRSDTISNHLPIFVNGEKEVDRIAAQ